MSTFSRNVCSTATRSLRQRACIPSFRAVRPAASALSRTPIVQRAAVAAPFSTMPALRDNAAAAPKAPKEFDHEITDMANYIHNYNVDSELAVSPLTPPPSTRPNAVR